MKDKQVGAYAIISVILFIIALASGGANEYADGFVKIIYYISLIGTYTFIIWGWVKLLKSDK